MPYFAHSGHQPDKSDWQTLQDHLQVVADIAKHNAPISARKSWLI